MLGVLDETGLLNEGEVYVQYTKDISFGETTRDTVVLESMLLALFSDFHILGELFLRVCVWFFLSQNLCFLN